MSGFSLTKYRSYGPSSSSSNRYLWIITRCLVLNRQLFTRPSIDTHFNNICKYVYVRRLNWYRELFWQLITVTAHHRFLFACSFKSYIILELKSGGPPRHGNNSSSGRPKTTGGHQFLTHLSTTGSFSVLPSLCKYLSDYNVNNELAPVSIIINIFLQR